MSLEEAKKLNVLFDADALWFITQNEMLRADVKWIAARGRVILTPNLIEFKRLWDVTSKSEMTNSLTPTPLPTIDEEIKFFEEHSAQEFGKIDLYHPVVKPIAELSRVFGNAIIIRKGITDIISDGN